MKLTKLSEIPRGESLSLLLYGGSGTGKSDFAGTGGNGTLIFDLADRKATWQGKSFRDRVKGDPYIVTITEGVAPDGGAKALDEIIQTLDKISQSEVFKEIHTIVIDEATALRRFAMNKGLELNQKIGKSKTAGTIKSLGTEVPFIPTTVQDFAAEMQLVEGFIYKLLDFCKESGKHLIITAHERIQFNKPESLGAVATVHSIKPGFTGQTFPDTLPGMFDLVWHTEVIGSGEQTKYRIRTVGDAALTAKTCYSGIFKTVESGLDWPTVLKKIREGR